MLLMHVTKDGKCCHCGAEVRRCALEECQEFFNPKSSRHVWHSDACKMARHREKKSIEKIRDELELDDE